MYFVVSDVHSFWDPFEAALTASGFEKDNKNHKLIVCGDMFDRGPDSLKCWNFIKQMYDNHRLVYVRGNHEDLLEQCLFELKTAGLENGCHISNGTLRTVADFCDLAESDLMYKTYLSSKLVPVEEIMNQINQMTVDYFELAEYVFVHGWVPTVVTPMEGSFYPKQRVAADWRTNSAWKGARWLNGMQLNHYGARVPDKTVVCGHWHCSWGWSHLKNKGPEFDLKKSYFEPFEEPGIIAIDSCTAFTRKVNCIKFTDKGERIL